MGTESITTTQRLRELKTSTTNITTRFQKNNIDLSMINRKKLTEIIKDKRKTSKTRSTIAIILLTEKDTESIMTMQRLRELKTSTTNITTKFQKNNIDLSMINRKKIDRDHQRQKKNERDEIHDSHHLTNRERHRIDHDNAKTERAEDINNKYDHKVHKIIHDKVDRADRKTDRAEKHADDYKHRVNRSVERTAKERIR